MSKDRPLYQCSPALAPLSEYVELLEKMWETGILTHNGPMVQELESRLISRLKLHNFVAATNGTVALQMAIRALACEGEIITTPFTWIATVSAIKWERCTPVFVDIDPQTLNIDPAKIEAAITPRTSAIMPVHVFGNPCDVDAIDEIARRHGLKVIYDAAHAVGSSYHGQSLLNYGDISATSLHATKLLNSGEGGGCVTSSPELFEALRRIRFFGHDENKDIVEDGLNGKMTEIHAALGLANLKYLDELLAERKQMYSSYLNCLENTPGVQFQSHTENGCNYSYFPIIFETESLTSAVIGDLETQGIYPRRYFSPSLNTLDKLVDASTAPISESISRRVICLPLHPRVSDDDIQRVSSILKTSVAAG